MNTAALLVALGAILSLGGFSGKAMAREQTPSLQSVVKAGTQTPLRGSNDYFTGNVRIDPLFPATPEMPVSGGAVTFEPGARSFWHTHPAGQKLLVLSGVGRTGVWQGRVEEIRAGDVVICPPGVKHWHGASPTSAMTHIAVTGALSDGKNVEWLEEVTDEQYAAGM